MLPCNYICGCAWQAAGKSDLEEADSGEGKKRRHRNGDEAGGCNEKDPQETDSIRQYVLLVLTLPSTG